MSTYLIGAGGVGSFVAPALCKLIGPDKVIIMDGDNLESKNLDRQLFNEGQIGMSKAEALGLQYACSYLDEWFAFGVRSYEPEDWLICCVDNHPARLAALQVCDYSKCQAIFAANETFSSEAYVYKPEWKDSSLDPRLLYPEIMSDHAGDPRRAAIGCVGEPQLENRQLVTANLMAAGLALHLYVVWAMEAIKLDEENWQHLPHHLRQNLSRSESFKANPIT